MKSGYLLQRIGATLGLSTLLAVSYPIAANAESNLVAILEDASGQVWVGKQPVGKQPYDQQLHEKMRIPFGTTIKIGRDSSVVFTYYWPTTINNPDDWYRSNGTVTSLDGKTLHVNCAKTVFMRNKGTNARQYTYKVIRYDPPDRCDVTDKDGRIRAQKKAMRDPSRVGITYYESAFLLPFPPKGDPAPISTGLLESSQRQRKKFWEWWKK